MSQGAFRRSQGRVLLKKYAEDLCINSMHSYCVYMREQPSRSLGSCSMPGRSRCWLTRCGPGCCPGCVRAGRPPQRSWPPGCPQHGGDQLHLRKLESVGLVTDTEEGEGKRRLWRAATDFHSWTNSAFRDDEDAATALGWLQRDYVRQLAEKAERWLDAAPNWPAEWVDVLGLNDTFVTVTPEQMRDLNARMDALLAEYRTVGSGDPRARRVSVNIFARPMDPRPTPGRGGRTMRAGGDCCSGSANPAAVDGHPVVSGRAHHRPGDAADVGARPEPSARLPSPSPPRGSWCWSSNCRRAGWPMRWAAVRC